MIYLGIVGFPFSGFKRWELYLRNGKFHFKSYIYRGPK